VHLIDSNKADPFERLRRMRWVFDQERLPAGTDAQQIADRLFAWLTQSERRLFHGWPRNAELKDVLRTNIELYSRRRPTN
jgi:hypothetical protein